MSTESKMPDWAIDLFQKIAAAVEFKSPAQLEAFHSPPEETGEPEDLIEIAPALMEMTGGATDGEEVYGILDLFDLVAARNAFDEVTGIVFSMDDDDGPLFQFEGKSKGHNVVVVVYVNPLEETDDEDEEVDSA